MRREPAKSEQNPPPSSPFGHVGLYGCGSGYWCAEASADRPASASRRRLRSFLKLCQVKYYNFSPLYNVQRDFSFESGDPLGPESRESDGGSSVWGLIHGPSRRLFRPEVHPKLKHAERGTVSMATAPSASDPDDRVAASQFIVTLGDGLDHLDGQGAIFGKVVEGFDVLEKINDAFCDEKGRPLKDIRIRHTVVLEDPFEDPVGLVKPAGSPLPSAAQLATVRIADDEDLDPGMDEEALERLRREREARAQALTLEMVGDLPFAEVKPPENILFVCKLNPVTQGSSRRAPVRSLPLSGCFSLRSRPPDANLR